MALPSQLDWEASRTKWKSQLDPVLANPLTNPRVLNKIVLTSGVNVINHGLQRDQQGWFITDINASASIYRSQPFNDKTLTLTSSAGATVNIVVY